MVHPDTLVQHTPKGLGLFAKRPFRRGEIIWILDDIDGKVSLADYQSLDPFQRDKVNIYSYLDYLNRVIIPWDEGKYVNHSCAPNITGLLQYDNISIVMQDIAAGEEIVEDYYSYFGHFETFQCRCGSQNCRKVIGQENSYHPELRLNLADMAPLIMRLPQPLLHLHSDENAEFIALLHSFAGVTNGSLVHEEARP